MHNKISRVFIKNIECTTSKQREEGITMWKKKQINKPTENCVENTNKYSLLKLIIKIIKVTRYEIKYKNQLHFSIPVTNRGSTFLKMTLFSNL